METQRFSKPFLALSLLLATTLQACGGTNQAALTSGDPRVVWSTQSVDLTGGSALLGSGFLTLNATIVPPGSTYADDVFLKGSAAFVSYNTPGTTAVGAIDYMNLTTPTNPTRYATYTSSAADINGVFVDSSNNLYAIGGDGVNGSMMYKMGVNTTTNTFTAVTSTTYLPSFAGTGVKLWGSSLYTITGDAGGLNVLNPSALASNLTPATTLTDVRGMDQSGSSNLWAIAGGGNLYEINAAGTVVNTVVASGANNIPESKSAVHVGSSMVAASLGNSGFEIVCMADHKVLITVPAPTVSGLTAANTVTNSVTFGNGLVFVANGLAGVYVYSIATPILPNLTGQLLGVTNSVCASVALTLQGKIDLGSTSQYSANNVAYSPGTSAGTLYVATGAGGFKVITVNLTLLSLLSGLLSAI